MKINCTSTDDMQAARHPGQLLTVGQDLRRVLAALSPRWSILHENQQREETRPSRERERIIVSILTQNSTFCASLKMPKFAGASQLGGAVRFA
jgi:hypothetical protein